jgi:hypothetical protein
MRGFIVAVLALFGTLCWPQSNPERTVRPQAIVQVQKTQMDADLVTISVQDPAYPTDLLKAQSEAVGANTGSGSRGVHLFPLDFAGTGLKGRLWKSNFAVDGLIDRKLGVLHLQPIVRALAGAPAPFTIRQFQIDFDYEAPNKGYPGDFSSGAVQIRRTTIASSLVYDVTILDQNPAHIVISDSNESVQPPVKVEGPAARPDWVILAAMGLGAVAIGALVYSLLLVLLRPGTPRRPRA